MRVSQNVMEAMEERLENVFLPYRVIILIMKKIGIFGSYARGDYKSTSDIDFCIIVKERPSHYISIYIIRNVWLQPAG